MTFEAAARLLSFTQSADELNVTQAAVSRQIAGLEARLGVLLFVRKHRRVELTTAGRLLSDAVSQGFNSMAEAIARITQDETRSTLVIGATTAFSHFWLMPRLPEFRRLHPSVTVRILAQDTRVRLDLNDIHGTFRYGDGRWNDGRIIRLFGDRVGPVCAPGYHACLGSIAPSPAEIAAEQLIEHDYADSAETGWRDYFRLSGSPGQICDVSVACSSYLDVVYAALAGQGIALGWQRLVGDLLANGQLVPLAEMVDAREAYYFIAGEQHQSHEALAAFMDWVEVRARTEGDGAYASAT
jgi:DNA-binding transcriptional LysR family regulator